MFTLYHSVNFPWTVEQSNSYLYVNKITDLMVAAVTLDRCVAVGKRLEKELFQYIKLAYRQAKQEPVLYLINPNQCMFERSGLIYLGPSIMVD